MKKNILKWILTAVFLLGTFTSVSASTIKDSNSYQAVADVLISQDSKKIQYLARKIEREEVYDSIKYGGLNSVFTELVKKYPKTILFMVDNFGDETLNLFNLKDYKRFKRLIETKALPAFNSVNSDEFSELAIQYIKETDKEYSADWNKLDDIAKKMRTVFESHGYLLSHNSVSSSDMMAYYRRFSTYYGESLNEPVENGLWKNILEKLLEVVETKIEEGLKTPIVEVSLSGKYVIYPNEKKQDIAVFAVDTVDSNEGVSISHINFSVSSNITDGELDDCVVYDDSNDIVSNRDDFEYIVKNGINVDIYQYSDKIKEYRLVCNVSDDLKGGYIFLYNATFNAELDSDSSLYREKILGYSGINIQNLKNLEVYITSNEIIKKLSEKKDIQPEEYALLKLSEYFVEDSNGGFGDGYYIHIKRMYQYYYDGDQDDVLGKDLLEWIKYFNNLNLKRPRIKVDVNAQDDSLVVMGEEAVFLDFSITPMFNDVLETVIVKVGGTAGELPFYDYRIVDKDGKEFSLSGSYIGDGKIKFTIDEDDNRADSLGYSMNPGETYEFKILCTPARIEDNNGLSLQLSIDSIATESTVEFPDIVGPELTLYYDDSDGGEENNMTKEETAAMLVSTVYLPMLLN